MSNICSRRHFKFAADNIFKFCCCFKQHNEADDSHEILNFIYLKNQKLSQNLLSAAVMIGAFMIKNLKCDTIASLAT